MDSEPNIRNKDQPGKIHGGVSTAMSRGYRYIVLAAFGWLALGASPPAEADQRSNTDSSKNITADAPSNYAAYPDKESERCYHARDHDAADLCAQWRAAEAAERGVWIALVGAGLSFISIALVVIALGQTRRANRISQEEFDKARMESAALAVETASMLAQARRSADAAFKAVGEAARLADTAETTAGHHLRAYVSLTAGKLNFVQQPDGKWIGYLSVKVENVGLTPAFKVRASHLFWGEKWPISDETIRNLQAAGHTDGENAQTIQPRDAIGITCVTSNVRLQTKAFPLFTGGERWRFVLRCTVKYLDFNGIERETDLSESIYLTGEKSAPHHDKFPFGNYAT